MARTRRTSREALDEKIEKAEADVIVAKKKYDHATAVLLHLVKKGSLTTCKTTDSVGVHGNIGNKSVKK